MAGLQLLPAVDVADGQAIQLVHGVANTGGRFGDPVAAALRWQEAGCRWLHLVDLDAAFGRGGNAPLLAEIVSAVAFDVELSGGISDDETLEAALSTGCTRVNIGTAALEDPDWCARTVRRHGEKVAVGLDVRGRTLAARGWTRDLGDLFEALERLDRAGCRRYVVTDIERDGLLRGPNLDLLRSVCARTSAPVIASGGARPSRTSPRWPASPRSGWKARSSAPRSTAATCGSRTRSPRPDRPDHSARPTCGRSER